MSLFSNNLSMKDFPVAVKVVLNVVFYLVYWAVTCFVVGMLYSLFVGKLDNMVAQKIGIFVMFVTLIVTLLLRKHFYMTLANEQEEVVIIREEKKTQTSKKSSKSDDGLKIKIEKEIK